jgi:hypothetical protein
LIIFAKEFGEEEKFHFTVSNMNDNFCMEWMKTGGTKCSCAKQFAKGSNKKSFDQCSYILSPEKRFHWKVHAKVFNIRTALFLQMSQIRLKGFPKRRATKLIVS